MRDRPGWSGSASMPVPIPRRRTTGTNTSDATARRRSLPLPGLRTGIASLDRALGGLRGLTLLGGRAGVGKSAFALYAGVEALRQDPDLAVLVVSLDMPRTVLYDRLRCSEAGLDFAAFSAPSPGAGPLAALAAADGRLRQQILKRLSVVESVACDWRQGAQPRCWVVSSGR